jgi:hypothetical protein
MLCEMARPPFVPFVAVLVLGCADVGTGDDTNPFGDGTTAASGQETVGPEPTSDEGTTAASGEATGTVTTGTPTTDAPTTEASTSGPPTGTSDATTAPGDTSDGGTGAGELGECIGIGAWQSCAQYCEAVLDVCVEGGCDGATVVYYGDVGDCQAMQGSGEATACDTAFPGGGSASFARCCCQ